MSLLINSDVTNLPFHLSETLFHIYPGSKVICHHWPDGEYFRAQDRGYDFRKLGDIKQTLEEVDTVINLWSAIHREYDYSHEFMEFINFCSENDKLLAKKEGLFLNIFFMGSQSLGQRIFYNGINTIIKQFHAVSEKYHKLKEPHAYYVMMEVPKRFEDNFNVEIQNDIIDKFTKYRKITKSLMGQLYKVE
jgi:hypothetical protein